MMFDNDYNHLYHRVLNMVYSAPSMEIFSATFMLTDPARNLARSRTRGDYAEGAKKFTNWILSGSSELPGFVADNPKLSNFYGEIDGRNTLYGPRIVSQLESVVEELLHTPATRRACIMILEGEDQLIRDAKRTYGSLVEYPCTVMVSFAIRDGQLNCFVLMRSNNVVTTICYDVHLFTSLQMEVLRILKERGADLRLGLYSHHMVNAHILPNDVELAKCILEEFYVGFSNITSNH